MNDDLIRRINIALVEHLERVLYLTDDHPDRKEIRRRVGEAGDALHLALRALESGEVRTEWGVSYRDGDVDDWYEEERTARKIAADPTDSGVLVRREIRLGPWTDADGGVS